MPIQPKFTDAGKALQLRALAGEEILFTKIQIGSGELGETSYKTFNALLDPKITVPIKEISVENGYAKIRGYFDNKSLDEGIYYREVGLFAKNPDDPTKEILYSYVNYGAQASFIADHTSKLIEHSVTFIAVVDDAENVSAIINGSAVYVDFTDMRRAIEEHNSDADAHPGMLSPSLTVYVDCNSTEDDELCDGSYEHPYKSIYDVEQRIPSHIKSLSIILKSTGDYEVEYEPYFGYSNLENIDLVYNGDATHRPIIHGSLSFGRLKSVNIRKIDFLDDGRIWGAGYAKLWFDDCNSVWITDSSAQCKTTDGCNFIETFGSTIYANNISVLNMGAAINAYNLSTVHILSGSFETFNDTLFCDNSICYIYTNRGLTFDVNEGLVITPETMEKISSGEILSHLTSTANPHRVSLTQVQQEGGVVDVAHGGTGQNIFTAGALLKGNGTDKVGMVTGAGALFAKKDGLPEFGTLPISMGGTGATSLPSASVVVGGGTALSSVKCAPGAFFAMNDIQSPKFGTLPGKYGGTGFSELKKDSLLVGDTGSSVLRELELGEGALYNTSNFLRYGVLPVSCGGTGTTGLQTQLKADAVDGARHGHIVIGFGSGPKILICWGRISVDLNASLTVAFSTRCGNYFKDANYTLVFSGDDIQNGKVTKENTRFIIDAGASRAADWIAIGEVHE